MTATTPYAKFKLVDDAPLGRTTWRAQTQVAERLVALLEDGAGSQAPPPILLTGDWGAGKTTVLRAIRSHLLGTLQGHEEAKEANESQSTGRVIWFDPWRDESEGALLNSLIGEVGHAALALVDQRTARTGGGELAEVAQRMRKKLAHAASTARRLTVPAAMLAATMVGGQAAAAFLTGVSRAWKEFSDSVDTAQEAPSPPEKANAYPDLVADLNEVLETAWGQDAGERPFILIDDLDRCSPQVAIALLEQIRALLSHERGIFAYFIIAMDRELLIKAVQAKFPNIPGYDGNRYLEKLFPLSFAVPLPQPIETMRILHSLKHPAQLPDQGDRIEQDIANLGHQLKDPVFANPRLIKRCFNLYFLLKKWEGEDNRGDMDAQPSAHAKDKRGTAATRGDQDLIAWIAAVQRWPVLRRMLREKPDEYWTAALQYEPDFGMGDNVRVGPINLRGPDGERLLTDRGAVQWAKQRMLGRNNADSRKSLRDADDRLQRYGL